MGKGFTRHDADFDSHGTRCAAWLYVPDATGSRPVIVMAHGLGGTREMRLDAYAERFAAAGYAVFLFDYRHFGHSAGQPRQLVSVSRQLEDWRRAIEAAKNDPRVHGRELVLFGTSFSGGHVIGLSAERSDVRATIAQCPYTDRHATLRATPAAAQLRLAPRVIADAARAIRGGDPVTVKFSGRGGETALMEEPDDPGFRDRFIGRADYVNETPARTALAFLTYSPGRHTRKVDNPILFGVCLKDALAPAHATIRHASRAPKGEVATYNYGHFEVYLDPFFKPAMADYLEFLGRMVG